MLKWVKIIIRDGSNVAETDLQVTAETYNEFYHWLQMSLTNNKARVCRGGMVRVLNK